MTPEQAIQWAKERGADPLPVFKAKLKKATVEVLMQTLFRAKAGEWKDEIPWEMRSAFTQMVEAELQARA